MSKFSQIMSAISMEADNSVLDDVINYYEEKEIGTKGIAQLATMLAESGRVINIDSDNIISDIASTGGPSSLSTLLCPLYLSALGHTVPKLGIPGRPAGAIDVLSQIPGYKIRFNYDDLKSFIQDGYYIHFLASGDYAPLDGRLYKRRKQTGKVDIPALTIASLISKKIAVGLDKTGLDVRVAPYGNFGNDFNEARINAEIYCEVAQKLGMHPVCLLTDGRRSYQPYVGRGEALIALKKIMTSEEGLNLRSHLQQCHDMAMVMSNNTVRVPRTDLREEFRKNLCAQGTDYDRFLAHARDLEMTDRFHITAETRGYIRINLAKMREAIVDAQEKARSENLFPDPVGVHLSVNSGDFVEPGDSLMSVREYPNESGGVITNTLLGSFSISSTPLNHPTFEIVQ